MNKILIVLVFGSVLSFSLPSTNGQSLIPSDQKSGCKMLEQKIRVAVQTAQAVSFYAQSTRILRNIKKGHVLVFSNAVTNSGGAYNTSNGKFIAPTDGHYVFYWMIVCETGNLVDTLLMRNGRQQGVLQADCRRQNGSGSNTVVLKLVKGDVVHLEVHGGHPYRQVYGDGYSSFSGWLIPYVN